MRTHDPVNEVTCEGCGKTFADRVLYIKHYKQYHTGAKYECDKCDKTFIIDKQLESHKV